MKWKDVSKYLGLFVFAVAVIAVYKTFDNIGTIFKWLGGLVTLVRPFIIGFVIAYILMAPCRFIEKFLEKRGNKWLKEHRRPIAVVTIYAAFILLIVLVLVAIVPAIVSNLIDFYNNLPELIGEFVNWFNSLDLGVTLGELTLVDGGFGGTDDFNGVPSDGKWVALVQRGNNLTFEEKVTNARNKGASAVII